MTWVYPLAEKALVLFVLITLLWGADTLTKYFQIATGINVLFMGTFLSVTGQRQAVGTCCRLCLWHLDVAKQ